MLTLHAHVSGVHGPQRKLPCDICGKEFSSPQNLRVHVKFVHCATSRVRMPCTFPGCGRTFLRKASLVTHFKTYHAQNPLRFRCTLCEKECKSVGNLAKHIASHTREKPYQCATCGRSFSQLGSLKGHEVGIFR